MPLKLDQREYRSINLIQPENRVDGQMIVEGYATTFNPYVLYQDGDTKYFERIDRKAFDGADMTDLIMQYDHQGKVLARTSNKTLQVRVDDHGLFIRADLSTSEASRELYHEIKSGLITRMSWAFTVSDEAYDAKTRTRIIKRVGKAFDVSAVSIPANDSTEISARSLVAKFGNADLENERQLQIELRRRQKARASA